MQGNTLFPMWFSMSELESTVDPDYAPNIYLMVYHKTSLHYVPIGRCEILASHIMRYPNKLCRYKIRWEADTLPEVDGPDAAGPSNSSTASICAQMGITQKDIKFDSLVLKTKDDEDPYILASFELFPAEYALLFHPLFPLPVHSITNGVVIFFSLVSVCRIL
jgi:hypothetical protein